VPASSDVVSVWLVKLIIYACGFVDQSRPTTEQREPDGRDVKGEWEMSVVSNVREKKRITRPYM